MGIEADVIMKLKNMKIVIMIHGCRGLLENDKERLFEFLNDLCDQTSSLKVVLIPERYIKKDQAPIKYDN